MSKDLDLDQDGFCLHQTVCKGYQQIQGVHGQQIVREKQFFFKVKELSGNFQIGKGISIMKQKVREKSWNFEIIGL